MRLLIAEDDRDVAAVMRIALGRAGHAVDAVGDGEDAVFMAAEIDYDAILLDVNLPPPDGFEVCRRLRARQVWAPVVFLTGRDAVGDRVTGLDAGGDDYLVKPVSVRELEARLRALTRRAGVARPTVLRIGDLEIDPASHQVERDGERIALTAKEFLLLETLARQPGQVVARSVLREKLWDFAFDPRSNVLDALVRRVRAKIDAPFGCVSLETVRGVGYRLTVGT